MDVHYRSLAIEIAPLAATSDEYRLVDQYMRNTHGFTHRHYTLDIIDLFAVRKNLPFAPGTNTVMLWHGSRLSNWAGILSQARASPRARGGARA